MFFIEVLVSFVNARAAVAIFLSSEVRLVELPEERNELVDQLNA